MGRSAEGRLPAGAVSIMFEVLVMFHERMHVFAIRSLFKL
jgi:hypothetical protein